MSNLVWITGAGGLIGHELVRSAPRFAPGILARGLARAELDLLEPSAVTQLFRAEKPAAIIHCAALSKSPACEANPDLARAANVEATRHLAQLAHSADGIPFIFFSTDLVFDGTKGYYVETDAPKPLSVYGATKASAEEVVREHPAHSIVRISLTGGQSPTGDRGFNEEMKKAWREGKTLNLFTDEYRCPSAAETVARAVWEIFSKGLTGTYHLCGSERLSRYEIGRLLAARHPELNPQIIAGTRADYKGPPRPADTSLDCSKLQARLSFRLPGFTEWLRQNGSDF